MIDILLSSALFSPPVVYFNSILQVLPKTGLLKNVCKIIRALFQKLTSNASIPGKPSNQITRIGLNCVLDKANWLPRILSRGLIT